MLIVGLGTLIGTILISFIAETLVRQMAQIGLAAFLLVIIIFFNVAFDIIGTAAAAAREAPFHAKAAKKVFGAPQSIYLLKNRDKVANIAQDVIGDIAGIIAGALGISLVFQINFLYPGVETVIYNVLITAVIASLIVTGKAYGKKIAVDKAEGVIFLVGKIFAAVERFLLFRRTNYNNQEK